MERELQSALASLARYRRLRSNVLDPAMRGVLEDLVEETRRKIAMLQERRPLSPRRGDLPES